MQKKKYTPKKNTRGGLSPPSPSRFVACAGGDREINKKEAFLLLKRKRNEDQMATRCRDGPWRASSRALQGGNGMGGVGKKRRKSIDCDLNGPIWCQFSKYTDKGMPIVLFFVHSLSDLALELEMRTAFECYRVFCCATRRRRVVVPLNGPFSGNDITSGLVEIEFLMLLGFIEFSLVLLGFIGSHLTHRFSVILDFYQVFFWILWTRIQSVRSMNPLLSTKK